MSKHTENFDFRPWGRLDYVQKNLGDIKWTVVGALGPEDRSIATPVYLQSLNKIAKTTFIEIIDPPSKYTANAISAISNRVKELANANVPYVSIKANLLDEVDSTITSITNGINENSDVILDVSSLPKRFFFLLIKEFLNRVKCRNFVITYTRPQSYPLNADIEPISQDCATHASLPGFSAGAAHSVSPKKLIVSVGHSVLNLPSILQDQLSNKSSQVVLLFPFPPGPPSYQKNWEFVENVFEIYKRDNIEIVRMDSLDVSAAYDFLMRSSKGGTSCIWLLPYGPKPVSIAMALFGVATEMPVYYTQPSRYRPDYSIGIATEKNKDGQDVPSIYSYPIRLNGVSLYHGL